MGFRLQSSVPAGRLTGVGYNEDIYILLHETIIAVPSPVMGFCLMDTPDLPVLSRCAVLG